jgi:hypothetical protein
MNSSCDNTASYFRVHRSHVSGEPADEYVEWIYGRIWFCFNYCVGDTNMEIASVHLYRPARIDNKTGLPIISIAEENRYRQMKYMLLKLIDAPVMLADHPDVVFKDDETLQHIKFVLLAASERL